MKYYTLLLNTIRQ